MKRLQLFEFEDQAWFPRQFRDAGTTYLQFVSRLFRIHEAMAPVLENALQSIRTDTIVDLCSGGTGPILDIADSLRSLHPELRLVVTDKFPNLPAFRQAQLTRPEFVTYELEPIDALNVPSGLTGLRTLFNAFHHFSPKAARQILQDAVRAGQEIAIFELSERRLINILAFPLVMLMVVLTMPFLRPFRWPWAIFTYLLPIIPITIAWDGVVSHWRAYSTEEFLGLAAGLGDGYEWRASRLPVPLAIAFFSGREGF